MDQVSVRRQFLNAFCASFSQKVNNKKMRIYFSCNVNHVVREEISEAFNFSRTNELGKYLVMPLLHKRTTKATFRRIPNKVTK